MKNVLLLLVSILCLTSCEVTEKIYINEDDSIRYEMETDITMMMKMDEDKNPYNGHEYPLDTIMTVPEMIAFMDGLDEQEENAKSNYNDIERAKMAAIFDDFKVRIINNDYKNSVTLITNSENTNALNRRLKTLSDSIHSGNIEKDNMDASFKNMMFGSLIKPSLYSYNGKRLMVESKFDIEEYNDIGDMDMDGIIKLFTTSKITKEFHFPRPVKFVSDSTAKLSLDRKTVFIDIDKETITKNKDGIKITMDMED